jgi:hypothetical protein
VSSLDILSGALSAALVVVCGALYAACFALGRLRSSRVLGTIAIGAYTALVVSAFVLADALALHRGWWLLVVVMLVGYWFAPRTIWRLSAATHSAPGERA